MKKFLVCKTVETIDYRYEEQVISKDYPVFVCDSEEAAQRWIDAHPLKTCTEETWYGKVELTDEYYIKEVPYFTGEINFEYKAGEDDDW